MDEVEKTVEERPATHKKQAQKVMFLIIAALIILLVFAVIKRINGGTQINTENADRAPQTETLAPDQQRILFEDRLRSAEQDLARANRAEQQGIENAGSLSEYELTIRQLKQQIEQERREREQLSTYRGGGMKPPGEKKTWQELEVERVRNARYAPAKLNLGFKDNQQQFTTNNRPLASGSSVALPSMKALEDAQQRLARYEAQTANKQATIPSIPVSLGGVGGESFGGGDTVIGHAASEQRMGPKVGQYLLPTGYVVKATLDQRSISDYPGPYRCRIAEDVYDVTKRFILIPKGAVCTGDSLRIQNVNEPIQARMGLNIRWVVLPDGRRISFKSQAMLDHEGINAVKGDVDRHLLAQFLGVAAYALVGSKTSYNTDESADYSGRVGESVREKAGSIAEKYLNLVPTIELGYGDPLRIFIEEEMYIYPWRRVGERYLRQ